MKKFLLMILATVLFASYAHGGTFRTNAITAEDGTSVNFPAGLTYGEDTKAPVVMVDTVAKLIAAVASVPNNSVIYVKPGTYTLTTKLTIAKPLILSCIGGPCVITSAATLTTELVLIELTAQSAASTVAFEEFVFTATGTNTDAVKINNTAVNQTLSTFFRNCAFDVAGAAGTGYGLDIAHATAGKIMKTYVLGDKYSSIENTLYTVANASDILYISNMTVRQTSGVTGSVNVSNGAVASTLYIMDSIVTAANATAGGNAANVSFYLNNVSDNGSGTLAAAVANDFDASGTETIVGL